MDISIKINYTDADLLTDAEKVYYLKESAGSNSEKMSHMQYSIALKSYRTAILTRWQTGVHATSMRFLNTFTTRSLIEEARKA